MQIGDIPPMLTMNPVRHTCQQGGQYTFKRADIPGMQEIRLQLSKQLPEPEIYCRVLTLSFVQCKDWNIQLNPLAEIRIFRHADYCMSIPVRRHVVYQVNQAILQASGLQAVNNMRYERNRPVH